MKAALLAGPLGAVTGLTALRLHGLDVPMPSPIRVVVPMQSNVPRHLDGEEVRIIASRTLRDVDVVTRRRVPITTPARSFLDLALPPSPAITPVRDTMIMALQRRVLDESDLRRTIDGARGMPGRRLLRQAMDDLSASGADSPFSHRVVRRLQRHGFRPDRRPVPIDTPGRVLHPDVTFSSHRVCLECDGLRWHSTQKDLAIDHRKDRAYRGADWLCLRIGWWEFDHAWNGFTAELGDALGRRRSGDEQSGQR